MKNLSEIYLDKNEYLSTCVENPSKIQVKFDFKAKWKQFYLDICNTFETNQNFSASSFQNMSKINKITSETRFDWILNFVCFFSAFLRRSSLFCADGIRVVQC